MHSTFISGSKLYGLFISSGKEEVFQKKKNITKLIRNFQAKTEKQKETKKPYKAKSKR